MALFNVQQMKQQAKSRPRCWYGRLRPVDGPQMAVGSCQWEMRMHLFILIPPQHFRCAINARTGTMRHITICIHVNTYPFIKAAPHAYIPHICLFCFLCPVSSVLYPVSNAQCSCVLWAKAIADHFSHTKAQKQ